MNDALLEAIQPRTYFRIAYRIAEDAPLLWYDQWYAFDMLMPSHDIQEWVKHQWKQCRAEHGDVLGTIFAANSPQKMSEIEREVADTQKTQEESHE